MEQNTTQRQIGLATIIFINFLILKLTSVIDWSWIWVLAPVWIPVAFKIVLWIILKIIELIEIIKTNKNGNN
jgi:hypothetical protein